MVDESGKSEKRPETDWERKRRLAEIFGDLPSVTSDEAGEPSRPSSGESASDRWLKAQIPPHHGS